MGWGIVGKCLGNHMSAALACRLALTATLYPPLLARAGANEGVFYANHSTAMVDSFTRDYDDATTDGGSHGLRS